MTNQAWFSDMTLYMYNNIIHDKSNMKLCFFISSINLKVWHNSMTWHYACIYHIIHDRSNIKICIFFSYINHMGGYWILNILKYLLKLTRSGIWKHVMFSINKQNIFWNSVRILINLLDDNKMHYTMCGNINGV